MNDILRPELIWIEGRCYRLNNPIMDTSTFHEHEMYENDVPYNEIDDEDDDGDDSCEIMHVDGSRLCTSLHVSKHYMGSVVGKKGATIARIGRDTRTDIKIPRPGDNKDIMIYGSNISNIKSARRRINMIVMSSRMKQIPTHFISIPINSSNIVKNFESFKENVLRECSGVEESLFIKSTKLHLTVGVMCLMDNEERMMASRLMTEAKDTYILPMLGDYLPFNIRLKGLSYMNDDPKEVDVLYGCVEEDGAPAGLLQRLVDVLYAHFDKAGFMKKEYDCEHIKMHVTLLNSKYRRRDNDVHEDKPSSQRSRKPRETFDGSEILSKFANYDFGVIELNNIHLSQRNCMGSDGYYQSSYVISLNKS